jgi:DNA polymerase-3 subunit delta'
VTRRTPARSQGFLAGLVGQDHAVRVLAATAASDRMPSLLFVGRTGTGKRTAALLFAQAVNCESEAGRPCGECRSCRAIGALNHADVRILFPVPQKRRDDDAGEAPDQPPEDPAPYSLGRRQPQAEPSYFIPISSIRWLRREMSRPPLSARRRFFIILGAERLRGEAANALLKTLEEPQSRSSFILTSGQPGVLPPTIQSRCQVVRFGDVAEPAIARFLTERAGADPQSAQAAAAIADGSIGQALRCLEQPAEALVPAAVDYFIEPEANGSDRLFDALSRLKGTPPAAVLNSFLLLHRAALLERLGIGSSYAAAHPEMRRVAADLDPGYLRRAIRHLLDRLDDCRLNVPPDLLLYTVLVALRRPAPARSPRAV